jgi:hypothetical protein
VTVTATPAQLAQGFQALEDLMTVVQNGIADKAADEALASDGFEIAEEMLPLYAPALLAANFLLDDLIQYNTQGEPNSETPMFGGPPSSRIAPP